MSSSGMVDGGPGTACDEPMSHASAFELLPWLANGTLPSDEHRRIEGHVRECLVCRAELKEQQALAALVSSHPTVHLSAEESFERLRGSMGVQAAERAPRRRATASLAAAAVLCVAVGGAVWLALSPQGEGGPDGTLPLYETVTDAAANEAGRIDVIFSTGTTETEIRALLAEIDGAIVGGPTSLGRYTLQLRSASTPAELESLVRRLADDERIRFAGRSFAPAGADGEAR